MTSHLVQKYYNLTSIKVDELISMEIILRIRVWVGV